MDVDVRATGDRIERLLAELRAHTDAPTVAAVEELVRSVVELYGAGLARLVSAWPDDPDRPEDRLTSDPLVESLLLLHGLHPLGVDERIERALDAVRPYLGSHAGGVEYLGVDADGVARLRLHGSCDGCASSARTVELAIEGAIEAAAPEVGAVEVVGVSAAPSAGVFQIGRRPPDGDTRRGVSSSGGVVGWTVLEGPVPSRDGVAAVDAGTVRLVLCDVGAALYAYLDDCPVCRGSVAAGVLRTGSLECPGCGTRYDVRRAGKATGSRTEHLEPVPLLLDGRGVRVALPLGTPA